MIAIQDDGFLDVTLTPAGGGDPVTVTLDVFEAVETFRKLAAADGPPTAFHAGAVAYLTAKGFPPMSHRSADAIVVAVADRAAELRKADAAERVAVAPPA